jgi:hypothetical protein
VGKLLIFPPEPAAMVTSTAQDSQLGKTVLVIHHGR